MSIRKLYFAGVMAAIITVSGCTSSIVPLTGRKVTTFGVSAAELEQQAAIAYNNLLKDPQVKVVSASNSEAQRVKRIGANIQNAVTKYMVANGFEEQIKGFKWEFNLIESPEINAWCMPGGKVAVYTGILPITKDDLGLATVMGHEVAHAIAQHSAERASDMVKAQLGGAAVGVLTSGRSEQTQSVINEIYGLGAQGAFILPNSRKQELEADKMGLSFMAMAGYDPRAAVNFWQRMAQASSNSQKPPVFLSTHPTDNDRIAQINKALPEALKYYNK
ncbi:MAG: M48 family peptidase [Pedobacter sp.]|nr:MAG: M48 family peptidase [Pedobacter sp.]